MFWNILQLTLPMSLGRVATLGLCVFPPQIGNQHPKQTVMQAREVVVSPGIDEGNY